MRIVFFLYSSLQDCLMLEVIAFYLDLFALSVVIRGEPHEDAVLCTEDKTYDLRLAETSNSLLVCPTLIYPTDASM